MRKNYPLFGFLGVVAIVALGALYVGLHKASAPAAVPAIPGSYSMDEVKVASTTEKCWAAIDGGVYDLTVPVKTNPAVLPLCGEDASAAVASLGKDGAANFASLRIGSLKN